MNETRSTDVSMDILIINNNAFKKKKKKNHPRESVERIQCTL